MTKPIRIQRTRKHKNISPNGLPTVYVGRPGKWGNPFKIGVDGTSEQCVDKYIKNMLPYTHKNGSLEDFYISEANIEDIISKLRGKNLSCWCAVGSPCHADFLLSVGNKLCI